MAFLTGRSGAGKSTLLRLIALLERPSRGQVQVCGAQLAQLARRQIPYHRRRVGLIFQDHRLLADRTVFENVALPLIIAGRPAGEEMDPAGARGARSGEFVASRNRLSADAFRR